VDNGRSPLQFYIDQPAAWDRLPRCVIVRGWCFGAKGEPVRGIRLQVAGCVYHGATGRPRPDVKAAFPEAPDDFTGFEIRAPLRSGTHELTVAALLPDGNWHTCLTRSVIVQRRWRPRWLGGGSLTELIAFQMPAHPSYPPRPLQPEKFPAVSPASRPRLSIVTPSFNQARFLKETMRSVLEQNAAVDYVVQDGGSTDASKALIRRFATEGEAPLFAAANPVFVPGSRQSETGAKELGARLVAWASDRDHGQADAIVKGFARTAGGPDDIMAWINSDDFYLLGALAYVADYFARHPEADVLYGHRVLVDEQSREIGRWFLPRHDPEVLRLNDFVPQETLFWRRRIWDKVGGIDPAFKFALDWDLLLRFQTAGARIVRVPYFLACFRIHPAQKTSAAMHAVGQPEIDRLRARTQGRDIPPAELERDPRLIRYLRRSAFLEFLWRCGIRAP